MLDVITHVSSIMSHQANITGREVMSPENVIEDTQTHLMSKVVAVEIKGTMNSFSVMGPTAAT
jgi:hypothetical protein